jgi:transcription elongation factor GreB
MNKAFVKESDEEDDDPPEAAQLPAGTRNYMTVAGHARLRDELVQLVKVERPNLVQVVAWAASNGDRSENGDYIYGKKRLREIDRRIRYLTKRVESAVVVDPAQQENVEQVFFGATVTIMDEAGGEASYQIVGVDEADAAQGRISWLSPLARALMKAREGDQVRFQSPAGWRLLEVVGIRYGED